MIGIDGCDFRILEPLFEKRGLDTFSEILKQGVHGTLISTKPRILYLHGSVSLQGLILESMV